jgi:hypothetical protein
MAGLSGHPRLYGDADWENMAQCLGVDARDKRGHDAERGR